MSSIMKELKTEIARLARKEINKELAPVKRVTAAQRGLIADLRRQLAALQKEIGGLRRAVPTVEVPVAAPSADAEGAGRFWITGKGVRTLRKRLGLTQAEFAKLAGVSGQTVVNWEATEGKIALRRKDTPAKLKEIRSLNKRAVRKIFEKAAKA
jgi:DNA-binding XRE family transcriptional regulator